jgi:hypothetical protein
MESQQKASDRSGKAMQTAAPAKSLAEFAARRRRKGLIHFG